MCSQASKDPLKVDVVASKERQACDLSLATEPASSVAARQVSTLSRGYEFRTKENSVPEVNT